MKKFICSMKDGKITMKKILFLIFVIFSAKACILRRRKLGLYCSRSNHSRKSLIDKKIIEENLSTNLMQMSFDYLNYS